MYKKDVSIIFVNYKTKDFTINAIESVFNKTQGISFEIFVVDNNSQDGSIEAIEEKFPNINIIKNPINAGFGAANNLAIKLATGKYILCLNTDTLLVNNAIKIMFDIMEKEENKNVGACGGYIYNEDMTPGTCGGFFPTITDIVWKFGLRNIFKNYYYTHYSTSITSDFAEKSRYIDIIIGADIFFRSSVLEKVGIFDDTYFLYMEETDLCKRIKNAGYDIHFFHQAKIIHLEKKSKLDDLSRKKQMKFGELIYFSKFHRKKVYIYKILYSILYFLDYYLFKKESSKILFKYIMNKNMEI